MAPLTKAQKVEKLATLGIAATEELTHAALDALFPENISSEPIPEESEPITSVTVRYHNPNVGETLRTFSHAVHGSNFQETAKQFAEKFNGTIE